MKETRIRAGITQGDINGIGYEVILKALADNRIFDICTPIIYGSPKVAAYHKKVLNLDSVNLTGIRNTDEANAKKAYIINCTDENIRVELGKSSPAAGEASVAALQKAVQDLKDNKLDVLITGPINKYNIQSDKFSFPGHTEFLQQSFASPDVLMLMVSDIIRIGVVTGHVPVSKVAQLITAEKILAKLQIINRTMLSDFAIRKPKIAVLGLNPHAGDNGVIGNEDKDIIIPAIEKARAEGIMALGPFPADGFFGSGDFKKFDAILAMYHDQGLIPFKTLTFEEGVNFTAGLPIVRTSPAHGTAFELAGKNEAIPDSFRQALYLACDVFKNRQAYAEFVKKPMKDYDTSNI